MPQTDPDHTLGEVSFRTMAGFAYYFVSGECEQSRIPETLCVLEKQALASMTGARAELDPVPIARYLQTDGSQAQRLQVGYRIQADQSAVPGTGSIEHLQPFPCVAAVYQGNVAHVGEAVELLRSAARDRGLWPGGEYREHYLYREAPDSPGNVLLLQVGVAAPGGGAPELPSPAEAIFSPVRVHTLEGYHFLYVDAETIWEDIEVTFESLLDRLGVCHRRADVMATGPMRFSFRGSGRPGLLLAEAGLPVAGGTQPPEGASVREVPPVRVGSIVLTGPYSGLGKASELLEAAIEERGLSRTGEFGEVYLHFDGVESPNTITRVVHPVQD